MKKILFVAHVQSHIVNFHLPFIKYFQDKGYEVYVATKLDEEKYGYIKNEYPNINWVNIDIPRSPLSLKVFSALKDLIKLMKQNKFKLVHVHTPVGGFLGRLAARLTNTGPVLYTAHGFHFFKGAPKLYWMTYYLAEKIAARWTDGIITINEEDYEIAMRKFKSKETQIFKVNGVGLDLNLYKTLSEEEKKEKRQELSISEEEFVIIMIAELNENKNQIQLIKAIELLKEECPNIKVMFVGEGDKLNELKEEAVLREISDKVLFLGFRTDINELINISDIGVLLSYREGLPRNIMEIMATGKAVICTDIRGNNDLIKDNVNGYLVDVNDIEGTYKKIVMAIENREKLNEFGRKSREIIEEYSIHKILKDMAKIYEMYIK